MRALLRPLSLHTVFSPIETIVFVFVLATLAYFHILDGIKHSSFFAPTFPSTLLPAYAQLSGSKWVPTTDLEWSVAAKRDQDRAIELQQIVFSLDEKARKVSVRPLRCVSGRVCATAPPAMNCPNGARREARNTPPRRVVVRMSPRSCHDKFAALWSLLVDMVVPQRDGRVG